MSTFTLEHCPVNPSLEFADSFVLPEGTTHLISKGGGSTIDVGKWLARKFKLHHTAIPTTAGTGSEVTPYCVLGVVDGKKTFTDKKFIPNAYELNPLYVISLPRLHTLSSGLDAYSQALESFWSKNATEESMDYSEMAIRLIEKNLKLSLDYPENMNARMDMMIAANLSGRAIAITKTNVCHAISYPLTDFYDIPHGIACTQSLAYFTKKALGKNIKPFLKSLDIPVYRFNSETVIGVAQNSEKLLDYPLIVHQSDLKNALR